jgi:hypothetical protein
LDYWLSRGFMDRCRSKRLLGFRDSSDNWRGLVRVGVLDAQRGTDGTSSLLDLEQHQPDFGAHLANGDKNGLIVSADEKDGPVVALDVDLGQVSAAEPLRGTFAKRQQRGGHRGDAILVHFGWECRCHRQPVERHDCGGLDIWRLTKQSRQDLVELT